MRANGFESGGGHCPARFFAPSGPANHRIDVAGKKKGRTMNPLTQSKNTTILPVLIALTLGCFGVSPTARAVDPPPDGGYPNFNTLIWKTAGSLNTARFGHTATLLQNGMVLVAGGDDSNFPSFRERGTVRPGEPYLDCHKQPQHRTLCSHSDVAAKRHGPCCRGRRYHRPFPERRTVRPGERDLDCHGQPQHRTR